MHKFEPGVEFSRKKGREEGTMWASKIWDNNFMMGCVKVKKKNQKPAVGDIALNKHLLKLLPAISGDIITVG